MLNAAYGVFNSFSDEFHFPYNLKAILKRIHTSAEISLWAILVITEQKDALYMQRVHMCVSWITPTCLPAWISTDWIKGLHPMHSKFRVSNVAESACRRTCSCKFCSTIVNCCYLMAFYHKKCYSRFGQTASVCNNNDVWFAERSIVVS